MSTAPAVELPALEPLEAPPVFERFAASYSALGGPSRRAPRSSTRVTSRGDARAARRGTAGRRRCRLGSPRADGADRPGDTRRPGEPCGSFSLPRRRSYRASKASSRVLQLGGRSAPLGLEGARREALLSSSTTASCSMASSMCSTREERGTRRGLQDNAPRAERAGRRRGLATSSGSSMRSRACARERSRKSSTSSSSSPTRRSSPPLAGDAPGWRRSCSSAIARIRLGTFVPTPSERGLRGLPGARRRARACVYELPLARSFVSEARRRVGPKRERIRPVITPACCAPRCHDRAATRHRSRAARGGHALRPDDGCERQPGHGEAVSQVQGSRGLPCRPGGGAQRDIYATGFFRQKASCAGRCGCCSRSSTAGCREASRSPCGCRAARKTANVVAAEPGTPGHRRGHACAEAVPAARLTREHDPVKIERDLIRLVPRDDWGIFPTHLARPPRVRRACPTL